MVAYRLAGMCMGMLGCDCIGCGLLHPLFQRWRAVACSALQLVFFSSAGEGEQKEQAPEVEDQDVS